MPACAFNFDQSINFFMTLIKGAFENIVEKGENAGNQHFLLLAIMFPTLYKTEIIKFATYSFLSSVGFNLDLIFSLSSSQGSYSWYYSHKTVNQD